MPLGTGGAIDNGVLVLLGVLCLVILSVSMWRRAQQRRATPRELTREQRARLRDQKELRKSMEELLVQLEEAATRINAQIDARMANLEALLRLADKHITRPAAPVAAPAEKPPRAADAGPAQFQRVCDLADKGSPAIAIAEALQMPVGEVELMLNLRSYSGAPSPRSETRPQGRGPGATAPHSRAGF